MPIPVLAAGDTGGNETDMLQRISALISALKHLGQ